MQDFYQTLYDQPLLRNLLIISIIYIPSVARSFLFSRTSTIHQQHLKNKTFGVVPFLKQHITQPLLIVSSSSSSKTESPKQQEQKLSPEQSSSSLLLPEQQQQRHMSTTLERQSSLLDEARTSTAEERTLKKLANQTEKDTLDRLVNKLKNDPSFKPDHPCLFLNIVNGYRFLRARNFNEADAEKLWRNAVKWRIEFKLSERREKLRELRKVSPGFDPIHDFIMKHFFVFSFGPDKYGIPITVTRPGTADPGGLLKEIQNLDALLERILDNLEQAFEVAIKLDRLDFGIVDVSDLRDFNVSSYLSRAMSSLAMFQPLAKILDEVYVERVREGILIGAPKIFQIVWKIVQPWIPASTKKKINLYTTKEESKWIEHLQKYVDINNVPSYMGGKGSDNMVLFGDLVTKGTFKKLQEELNSTVCNIGIIADVQHTDSEDGYNFRKTRVRRYRGALTGLKTAVDEWNKESVQCVIQLGDLLDGTAANLGDSEKAIERMSKEFARLSKQVPIHHVIGNHELYNFSREELAAQLKAPIHPRSFVVKNIRFVIIDAYEHAVIGVDESHGNYHIGKEILLKNHPRDWRTSNDWLNGIVGVERRFVPYNGALSKEQLNFLEKEIQQALNSNQYITIISHVPIQPGSCSSSCLIWNFHEVLNLIQQYPCSKYQGKKGVVAVFAGHDHKGGYAVDKYGIHHITLASPLEAPDCLAHGILKVNGGDGGMLLVGSGNVKHRGIPFFKTSMEVEKAYNEFVQSAVREFYQACVDGGFNKKYEECEKMWFEHGGAWDALPEGWPLQYSDGG